MAKKKPISGGPKASTPQSQQDQAKLVGPAISAAQPGSPEMEKLDEVVNQHELPVSEIVKDVEPRKEVTRLEMPEAYTRHLEAEKLYLAAAKKLEETLASLDLREEELLEKEVKLLEREEKTNTETSLLVAGQERIREEESALVAEREELQGKISQLYERERSITVKESELLTGRLADAFDVYIKPLEEKRESILRQLTAQIGATQESVRHEWEKSLRDLDASNDEFRQGLIGKMRELESKQIELQADEVKLGAERESLNRERELLETQREELLNTQMEEVEARRTRLEIEYQTKRESLDRRENEAQRIVKKGEFIREWEDSLGDVERVQEELVHLKSIINGYELELAKRRSLNDENELISLRLSASSLTDELDQLRREHQAKVKEIATAASRYLEAEAKLSESANLQSTIEQYKLQVEQLKKEMDNLAGVKKAESPFSECSRMDVDESLQIGPRLTDSSDFSLSQFVDQMQWLLYNPLPGDENARRLSYRKNDLRVFVAGLNTSRLHILEGVSGTGKTTLPIAFVRALGGGDTNTAIQAGWRDRQDLLGYYNEFQGQFRETDFLRGMYRAMTPKFQNGMYFMVLDEMNLSKVEQYFADYLKGLEDAAGADVERGGSVPLMDKAVSNKPRFLQSGLNGGVELPLPPNVWFIGTANQDESTQSFAPKTQSRAHIMELPHEHPDENEMLREIGGASYVRFTPETLDYRTLQNAFREAEVKPDNARRTEVSQEIFKELRRTLAGIDSSLALGPRFERQLSSFMPVILETGGTVGLGIDHLVATKFIRRMRENYKINATHRKTLSDALEKVWKKHSLGDYGDTNSHSLLKEDDNA
jgi:hypothetical protein